MNVRKRIHSELVAGKGTEREMPIQHRPARGGPVRNGDVGNLLESFLVSAAVAFLGIRTYLALTNYPQVAGHGFHIAHMLWGGLLMLVGLVLLLAFLGGRIRAVAAVLGGLGFGTFIDELGKFITSDDNYFFQPTIAIIYAIFIILYLVFRAIEDRSVQSPRATLAQALDATTTAALSDFAADDRRRALRLLADTSPADPVARSLQQGVSQVQPHAAPAPMAAIRLIGWFRARYGDLVQRRWSAVIVVVLMGALAVTGLASVVMEIVRDPAFTRSDPSLSLGDAIKIAAGLATDVMVVIGLIRLGRSRLTAFEWFKRAVLVSMFLVQFFSFYESGLSAAWGLLLSLFLLSVLNYAITREKSACEGAREPWEVPAA
jgi:hypothetical protein